MNPMSRFYNGEEIYTDKTPTWNHPMQAFGFRLDELIKAAMKFEKPEFETMEVGGVSLPVEMEKSGYIGKVKGFWLEVVRAERRGMELDEEKLAKQFKQVQAKNKKILSDAIAAFSAKLRHHNVFVPSLNGYLGTF